MYAAGASLPDLRATRRDLGSPGAAHPRREVAKERSTWRPWAHPYGENSGQTMGGQTIGGQVSIRALGNARGLRIKVLLPNSDSTRSTASTAVLLRTSKAGFNSMISNEATRPEW